MSEPEIVGAIVERILAQIEETILESSKMTEAEFFEKSGEILAGLQAQIEAIKQGPGTPEGFYDLYKTMEGYRDLIWNFLQGLPGRERRPVQERLPGEIFSLMEEARELAVSACEKGIIYEWLSEGIGTISRYAHLSQEHLRDSVNLLNDLPGSGKEMVNIPPKSKKAGNLAIATH